MLSHKGKSKGKHITETRTAEVKPLIPSEASEFVGIFNNHRIYPQTWKTTLLF